jgi:hypothetical protein
MIQMKFRKTVLASVMIMATTQAWAADVTGTWQLAMQTNSGSFNPTLNIKQTGETITGTFKGRLAEVPLSGTVNGNDVTIMYTISPTGQDIAIKLTGTVDGASMSGKMLGDAGEGTFKGIKQ